ncbi:hypothetical protein PLESTB_000788900 [Pleodorina starrii]|uniref:SET domain-containing protein n=1 Tax=Pleodorina starrii TaxID=330485 RepID=A0A9W6F228_9CHLO|nr:hypothetical protein PLESTB_000788900 [Pleodorina starrii]
MTPLELQPQRQQPQQQEVERQQQQQQPQQQEVQQQQQPQQQQQQQQHQPQPQQQPHHQHQPQQPGASAGEVTAAAAATIRHLHGCAPQSQHTPPSPPIELQVAGVKFLSGLGVRQRMQKWVAVASQTERLHDMTPADDQLSIPLLPEEGATAQPPQPWAAAFRAHHLNPFSIRFDLSVKLGLADDGRWGAPLPSEPLEPVGVEVRQDNRGRGLGLFTTQPIRANNVICVMGGLMMAQKPDGVAFIKRGFRSLPCTMKQQLRERVAGSSARPDAEEQLCWGFLAASFRMAFPAGHEDGRAGCPAAGLPPLELQMLGHGGLAAYINDPRVGAGCCTGAAAGGQGQQQQQQGDTADTANCLVVPVLVRGVPLPVLVALRDIAPGEQLLREYGNDWWSSQENWLETFKMYGISPNAVLHGPAAATPGAAIP